MSANWFAVGHHTNEEDRTGCTVILFDDLVPAAVDVRGGAPGTRETTLLDSSRRGLINAIVFSGGSAFGLRTVDGVMAYLSEHGTGYMTNAGPVPLVPAAIIFDMGNGNPHPPTVDDGYRAAKAATKDSIESGRFGAGTGATVAKLSGNPVQSGFGSATVATQHGEVTALVVVNAVGDIVDPASASYLARADDQSGHGRSGREQLLDRMQPAIGEFENTTIGAVLISASADEFGLHRCCIAAHDALARCVVPAHTVYDGDTFFVVAHSQGRTDETMVAALAAATELAVETAIVSIFAGDLSRHID